MTQDGRRGEIREFARTLASGEALSGDPELMAERAGAEYAPAQDAKGSPRVRLRFLNRPLEVILDPEGARVVDTGGTDVPEWMAVVALHYLATASGAPLEGREISYKEVRDAHLYYPVFQGRVMRRLEGVFGDGPGSLLEAALPLGGEPVEHGDAAVRIPALPRVPLTFIIWGADDEFPARAAVLFDGSVEGYLPAEDMVVLCQMVSGMLAANHQKGGG